MKGTMEEKDQKQKREPSEEDTNIPGEQETPGGETAAKLEQADQQVAHYKDLFLRKAAEFDNFKRRMESETSAIIKFANEDLLLAILPVIDDLERSLKNTTDEGRNNPFYQGVELIYQKMLKVLETQGVKPFETVGKEFDVHYHDALLQVPKERIPPHTILEEVEKGYLYNDKVLRHAKVIVSAGADPAQEVDAGTASQEKPNEG